MAGLMFSRSLVNIWRVSVPWAIDRRLLDFLGTRHALEAMTPALIGQCLKRNVKLVGARLGRLQSFLLHVVHAPGAP